ncbi:MAG: hypothetical protein QME07_02965 [bacterium]|nr:hypothetical protein [bacterium]
MKFFKIFFLLAIGFSITPFLVFVSNKKPTAKPSISELEKIRGEKEEILIPPPTAKLSSNIEPQPERKPCPCGRK